jgi:hypothetical protein
MALARGLISIFRIGITTGRCGEALTSISIYFSSYDLLRLWRYGYEAFTRCLGFFPIRALLYSSEVATRPLRGTRQKMRLSPPASLSVLCSLLLRLYDF